MSGVSRTYASARPASTASFHDARPALSRSSRNGKPAEGATIRRNAPPPSHGGRGGLECNGNHRLRERQVRASRRPPAPTSRARRRRQPPGRAVGAILNERIVGNRQPGQEQLGIHSDRVPGQDPVPLASGHRRHEHPRRRVRPPHGPQLWVRVDYLTQVLPRSSCSRWAYRSPSAADRRDPRRRRPARGRNPFRRQQHGRSRSGTDRDGRGGGHRCIGPPLARGLPRRHRRRQRARHHRAG
jgi:hypothetical protein